MFSVNKMAGVDSPSRVPHFPSPPQLSLKPFNSAWSCGDCAGGCVRGGRVVCVGEAGCEVLSDWS